MTKMMLPHHDHEDDSGFERMTMQTETALPTTEKRCYRRFLLGYFHIAVLMLMGLLLGVALHAELGGGSGGGGCNLKNTPPPSQVPGDSSQVKLKVGDFAKFPSLETTDNGVANAPKIAWLMSFPNSGTSFTSKLVRHLSQMSTASNYGEENLDVHGKSLPIYGWNYTQGPFWIDPALEDPQQPQEHPTTYVLTKTHCGGRCEKCGPSKYIENPHSFLQSCLSGKRAHVENNGTQVVEDVTYDAKLVSKAVHLIRSPFDNVVSRFHLELHRLAKRNDTEKLKQFPGSRAGFRAFCRVLNENYAEEEETSRWLDPSVYELMKQVPCHGDFFRYVQWHNLAFVTTQTNLGIPTYVLHYEDYETRFEETVEELLHFLELDLKGESVEFIKGKEYVEYFTEKERKAVKKGMKLLALSITWENTHHYFV